MVSGKTAFAVLLVFFIVAQPLAAEETENGNDNQQDGWASLFDGKTLELKSWKTL
ncbi:MAG: hypothetical protein P8K78_01240 [Pirellulales bacterium]|nr:hypothetical protein [Pirellulales bacterium]